MAWANGMLAIKVTQQTGDLTNTTDSSKATAHRNGTRLIIIAIPKLEHPNFLLQTMRSMQQKHSTITP